MITWDDNLRCSERIRKELGSIRRRVKRRRATSATTFCVTLATNEKNLFDIYNMGELLFEHYRGSETDLHIIGLANTREEACELAAELIGEIYEATGGFDVRKYFGAV